jgi:hypothetical protein
MQVPRRMKGAYFYRAGIGVVMQHIFACSPKSAGINEMEFA